MIVKNTSSTKQEDINPHNLLNFKRVEILSKGTDATKQWGEAQYSNSELQASKLVVISKRKQLQKRASFTKLVQMNDIGLQSSKGNTEAASSLQTTNMKRKVYTTISNSRYTLALREISIIVLLNTVIWIACIITLALLDKNYNKELQQTIRAR